MKKRSNEAPSEPTEYKPIPAYLTLPLDEFFEALSRSCGQEVETLLDQYYHYRSLGHSQLDCIIKLFDIYF